MESRPDAAELVDLVAQSAAEEAERDAGDGTTTANGRPGKRQRIYADHLPLSAIEAGIKQGTIQQVSNQFLLIGVWHSLFNQHYVPCYYASAAWLLN